MMKKIIVRKEVEHKGGIAATFENINPEIARRALGKEKFIKRATIPSAEEAVFGCAGGLHAKKGANYYCPAFVIPMPKTQTYRDVILCTDIHNLSDGTDYIGIKVTDAITGQTLLEPTYTSAPVGGFKHIRSNLYIPKISKSLLFDIHIGIKLGGSFVEKSRFRVALQVSGTAAVAEYSTDELDIVYPNTNDITVYPADKPYPIATTLWLYLLAAPDEEHDLRLLPILRLQGEPIKGSEVRLWAMNGGYYQSAVDLRWSAFAVDEAYWELTPIAEDMPLGYHSGIITRKGYAVQPPEKVEDDFAITFYFALGNQTDWWKPWDWKADEALMLAWGRHPDYYLDVLRAGVINYTTIGEDELIAYAEKFVEESNHRGAVGAYPTMIYYDQKLLGGALDTYVIAPSYSPMAPAVAHAIVAVAIAAGLSVIGFVVLNVVRMRHEEVLKYDDQSLFDAHRFETPGERIEYDQANYGDEMKDAGLWPDEFYDPVTGEKLPEWVDTPVEEYKWLIANHPEFVKDVYGVETVAKLTITTKRWNIPTMLPVTIELQYHEGPPLVGEWKDVKDYPKEVDENPSEHTDFVATRDHRVRVTRGKRIITELCSGWKKVGTPEEFGDKKISLSMRRRLAIGEEED